MPERDRIVCSPLHPFPGPGLCARWRASQHEISPKWADCSATDRIPRRKTTQKRVYGTTLSHLQIAENIWDPVKKRSRVRILYNCGRADDAQAVERLRGLARSILKRCSPEELVRIDPGIRMLNAWTYGDIYVLE